MKSFVMTLGFWG